MADELTLASTLLFIKGGKRVSFNKGASQIDVSGTDYVSGTQQAPSSAGSAVALDKGNITTLGWLIAYNNDPTVTVNVLTQVGGTVFTYVPPLTTISMPIGSGVTAPAILSTTTATPELEYALIEA